MTKLPAAAIDVANLTTSDSVLGTEVRRGPLQGDVVVLGIDWTGYSIGYDVSGSGPPLVLVDGLTMWAEQWVTAGYVSAFEGRHCVIRVDPLGHGQSDKPHDASTYTWRACISDLLAVVDAEHIDRGHWWGVFARCVRVQDLAHFYPERVISAIFGSPVEDTGAVAMPAEPVPRRKPLRRVRSEQGCARARQAIPTAVVRRGQGTGLDRCWFWAEHDD